MISLILVKYQYTGLRVLALVLRNVDMSKIKIF